MSHHSPLTTHHSPLTTHQNKPLPETLVAKILVIEDDPANRDLMNRFLNRAGFEVLLAEDPDHALELAASESPKIALMDLTLDKHWNTPLNGIELTRKIKELPAGADIRILAVTAHAYEDMLQQARDAGCDDFCVTKPINYPELVKTLKEMMSA
jgi:CheY-like chemotaxis protein